MPQAFLTALCPGTSLALAREGGFVWELVSLIPQVGVMVRKGMYFHGGEPDDKD